MKELNARRIITLAVQKSALAIVVYKNKPVMFISNDAYAESTSETQKLSQSHNDRNRNIEVYRQRNEPGNAIAFEEANGIFTFMKGEDVRVTGFATEKHEIRGDVNIDLLARALDVFESQSELRKGLGVKLNFAFQNSTLHCAQDERGSVKFWVTQ
mgnify:CR=1 FL=1